MALSTVRGPEVTGRVDKQSGHKTITGPTGPVQNLANVLLQHEGARVDSRDNSPDSRGQPRRSAHSLEQGKPSRVSSGSSALNELEKGDAPASHATCPKAPVEIKLDVCPSFSEQKPQGTKPLWLERHGTLRSVHLMTVGEAPPASPRIVGSIPVFWLPSWEIAKSNLWLLVETSLLHAQAYATGPNTPLPSPGAQHTQPHHHHHYHPPPLPSVPEGASSLPSESSPDTPSADSPPSAGQPAPVPPPMPPPVPLTRATPFAARPTQFSLVQQQSNTLGLTFASTLSTTIGALKRSCSVRAVVPSPRGLGPLPLSRTPTILRSSSIRSRLQQHSDLHGRAPNPSAPPDVALAACSSSSSAPQEPQGQDQDPPAAGAGQQKFGQPHQHHPHQHHLAFAAGMAAATSTAATVSQGLHAAAAGLATVLDAQVALESKAVELGANMVHAGTTFVMNRMQTTAIQKSTVATAEAVLGPAASGSLRAELRKRLRVTLAGASVLWFLFNLHGMSGTLAHLDFENDFFTSTRVVMNLATSGPALMENCRELLQVGLAVAVGMNQRHASPTAAADEYFQQAAAAAEAGGGAGGGEGMGDVDGGDLMAQGGGGGR